MAVHNPLALLRECRKCVIEPLNVLTCFVKSLLHNPQLNRIPDVTLDLADSNDIRVEQDVARSGSTPSTYLVCKGLG